MLAIVEPILEPHIDSLWMEPWVDDVFDVLGHDPKSAYVERFWLGLLGPSSTWLLRAISYGFDAQPDGFSLAPLETAKVLGIGDRTGRHSPFQRALVRLCTFELAYERGGTIVVRRRVPWLEPRQVRRLPDALRNEHVLWEQAEADASPLEAMRRRAASVAMSTIRTGGTVDDAERSLIRANVHPAISRSMAEWAHSQHQTAVTAATRIRAV